MQSEQLNKRVRIRAWQDVPSGSFDVEQTFDVGAELWAAIVPAKGATYYGAKQVGDQVTHMITVRLSPTVNETTVTPAHVIEHETENKRYRVKRSMDLKGEGRFLQIECELLGAINA